MKTSPDSRQRGIATWVYVVLLAATAGASFLILMLYQNVVARKAEATKDVFRVVEVSDETVDPAIWGKNYPRQYDSYKRTVESFSLRSVKLRHHRGPLFTVPFGELGAEQNMSRDWVIDKMMIGITYESNLDTAKKLIKQIGKELAADPEFKPHIIEPLKMQGVEQFGDYAIQIRMKMMTKPGEQFSIRRKALALIKKAFDANGIHFAFPTVQVAQGEDAAAAARQAIEIQKAKMAPEGA